MRRENLGIGKNIPCCKDCILDLSCSTVCKRFKSYYRKNPHIFCVITNIDWNINSQEIRVSVEKNEYKGNITIKILERKTLKFVGTNYWKLHDLHVGEIISVKDYLQDKLDNMAKKQMAQGG